MPEEASGIKVARAVKEGKEAAPEIVAGSSLSLVVRGPPPRRGRSGPHSCATPRTASRHESSCRVRSATGPSTRSPTRPASPWTCSAFRRSSSRRTAGSMMPLTAFSSSSHALRPPEDAGLPEPRRHLVLERRRVPRPVRRPGHGDRSSPRALETRPDATTPAPERRSPDTAGRARDTSEARPTASPRTRASFQHRVPLDPLHLPARPQRHQAPAPTSHLQPRLLGSWSMSPPIPPSHTNMGSACSQWPSTGRTE